MSPKAIGRPVEPKLKIPDDGLGPAMLALSPGHRAFVYFKVFGLMNNKDAAVAAGYSDTGESAKTTGYQLAHRDDVQAAIREETRKLGTEQGPKSLATMIHLRDKAKDERVRLKAATDLLALCGLGPISQSHIQVDHTVRLSDDELDRETIGLARSLGFSEQQTRKLLMKPDRIIEGEFTEVSMTPREMSASAPTKAEREYTRDLARENELRREMAVLTPEEKAERKRLYREQMRAQAKARYAAARNDIAVAVNRGVDMDVTAAVADAEAQYALTQAAPDADDDLADLLGETTDD